MQESYISLDPAQADSMTAQQRNRVWSQRVQEACGGDAGQALATQMGVTFMVCSYTLMRGRGFRVTPLSGSKIVGLGGILLAGSFGYGFGSSVAGRSMGNSAQYYHLMGNKRSIVNGSTSFDAPKTQ